MNATEAGEKRANGHAGVTPAAGTPPWAPALVLVAITFAVYLPAIKCGFIWDDDAYLQNNQALRTVDGLRRIWFELRASPQYYPMVFTSFWLEYRLWGLHPAGYHIVNILLHAGGAVLLWRILLRLKTPGAFLAAAIFALHPVHAESVAWITERKNVLSGVFYMGAALAWLKWIGLPGAKSDSPEPADAPSRLSRASENTQAWYPASLALFLLAVLSKSVTCTLPAALLLVVWWKRGCVGRREVRSLLPFFIVGIIGGLFTAWLEKNHVRAIGEEWGQSFPERCLIAGRAIWFYATKLIWPHPLIFIYPRWEIDAASWRQWLYPLSAVGMVIALWRTRRRLGRGPLTAALFFGGTLFPALGFFNVYPMRYSFVADHFQYLASVGLITLFAAIIYQGTGRLGAATPAARRIIAALLALTLGGLTWQQGRLYANLESLWRDTVANNPGGWIGHLNLGCVLRAEGKQDEALTCYREAQRLKPYAPEVLYNWGVVSYIQGKPNEAIQYYRRALERNPDDPKARSNLGGVLREQGETSEAITHFRKALEFVPDSVEVRYNLGMALQSQGDLDEAMSHFRRVLEIRPDWPAPMAALAWSLATHPDLNIRRPEEAIRLAEQASRATNHQDAAVVDVLAAAYAAAGRFDRARVTARAALDLATAAGAHELAQQIRQRLELYVREKPYQSVARPPQATRPASGNRQ